ncbi:MAG: outer membrane protein transport protein [Hyphomicrobiales bacterium]
MSKVCFFSGTVGLAMIASTAAISGGFSRGGVDFSLLYSDKKIESEAGFRFVAPQRTIDSATRLVNLSGGPTPLTTTDNDVTGGFFVPKAAFKVGIGDHGDCVGTFSTPFGADVENGLNTALSGNIVEFEIDTKDYGLTCSAKFNVGTTPLGEGRLRVIGGGSFLQFEGFLSRQSLVDFVGIPANFLPPAIASLDAQGVGLFELEDNAFGWRAGLAYEIPKSAVRVSAVYSSSYDIDASGTVDISDFNTPAALANPTSPISLSTVLPQQIDVNIQSGINEKTLAFARFNWTDWSELGSIPVEGVLSAVSGAPLPTSFDPLFQDGYTITGGLGRTITENLSGQLAITWDRGTSSTRGSQSDTWLLSTGLNYKVGDNISAQLGGAVGVLTSGSTPGLGGDPTTATAQTFGNDFIGAFTANAKISF